MRTLTRMKLINWHYFSNETIDFHGSTLITGDNGAGKSTLIDALQLVIIANLKKIRFNSSAFEERTTRDLKSYLRGKTGTEGGQHYLRSDDFSSYLVLEISNTKLGKSYLIGVVFDYFSSRGEEEHTFFRVDEEGVRDELFFKEPGLTRNRQEFFHYLKSRNVKFKQYRNDVSGYIHDLRQLFGGIKESFFPLFQKGISFSPITDLRKFVYDYILEERHVDVDTMRDYFEKFRQVEEMIVETEKEVAALEKISKEYGEIARLREQYSISRYMALRGSLEEKKKAEGELLEHKDREEKAVATGIDCLKARKEDKEQLEEDREALEREIQKNQVALRETALKETIKSLELRLKELKETRENLLNGIKVEIKEQGLLLDALSRLEAPVGLTLKLGEGLEDWRQAVREEASWFPRDPEYPANSWREAMGWLDREMDKMVRVEEETLKEIDSIKEIIRELEKNQVLRSDSPTMKLKAILEKYLIGSKEDPVPVHIFCEAVEVRDKTWQKAIEGYLHTQKFDLLVPPGYFDEALSLYERHKFSHNIENVGLVNTGKLLAKVRPPQKGSLAEEVMAEIDYIIAYANWLMGGVIKCRTEKELKQHPRSITPTCMLYQNHTARQIPARRYETPYIGKEAVKVQLEQKRELLKEKEEALRAIKQRIAVLKEFERFSRDKKHLYTGWQDSFHRLKQEKETEDEIFKLQQELLTLDRSELEKLEKKKATIKKRLALLDDRINAITGDIGAKKAEIAGLTRELENMGRELDLAEKEFDTCRAELPESLQAQALMKWDKEAAKKEPGVLKNNYSINMTGLNTRISKLMEELIVERNNFVHEYNFHGDSRAPHNDDFDRRLTLLIESHLQDYREKAEEAREQAEKAFQEHFISKLRESLDLAREEIRELNRALKDMRFGSDSYRFSLTSKNEMKNYYDMIMDSQISSGASLFNNLFMENHREAMESFFREITRQDEEFQVKMQELTDYRSYLDFDIEISDENGNKSYFSRVARAKSGGETQVPFYVAILASFYQAYQMYRNFDTLRLVVFDEAFNRMDADRIEEAVRFIDTLGFQAFIVAPTGKIQLIVPHVNTNLIIMRDGFTSFVERVSRKEIEAWS